MTNVHATPFGGGGGAERMSITASVPAITTTSVPIIPNKNGTVVSLEQINDMSGRARII